MTLKAGLGTVDTEFPLVDVQNALVALAMAIIALGAEVLDVFDYWSPRDA
jgi:hypothetical protein